MAIADFSCPSFLTSFSFQKIPETARPFSLFIPAQTGTVGLFRFFFFPLPMRSEIRAPTSASFFAIGRGKISLDRHLF